MKFKYKFILAQRNNAPRYIFKQKQKCTYRIYRKNAGKKSRIEKKNLIAKIRVLKTNNYDTNIFSRVYIRFEINTNKKRNACLYRHKSTDKISDVSSVRLKKKQKKKLIQYPYY